MAVEVFPVNSRRLLKAFFDFPYQLYRDDPHWIPPLRLERREMLSPKKNPFFAHAKVQLFLAMTGQEVVGRISAHINHLHNKQHGENTGHFGLFDSGNDQAVANSLFAAAQGWLSRERMNKICGPYTMTINEEAGVLIDGFDQPLFPYMAYNPPYYQGLFENFGFAKVKDLYAWNYDSTQPIPEAAMQIAEAVRSHPGLVIRELNTKKMAEEIRIISDIYHSAWQKNWGFIPWTEGEMKKMAKDLKLILDPKLCLIAEVGGRPAAISMAIPNYFEAISDLNGRLFPLGIFKLLYRLKLRKVKSCRLAILGIKKEYRGDVLGGLSVLLYVEMHRRSQELRHWGGELSWTLEDNEKINHGISLMGGKIYKRYRIYEKEL